MAVAKVSSSPNEPFVSPDQTLHARHNRLHDINGAAGTKTRSQLPAPRYKPKRTVRQILADLKSPRNGDGVTLVSAHRGHTDVGVVENAQTFPAILRAAEAGAQSIEIDIRLTLDGTVVCLHDHGIGRVTNIAEVSGRPDVYDPMTGKGYNPLVSSLPWKGCLENLKLKDHQGTLTTQGIMTLDGMLTDIRDAGLQLVVLLDIKSKQVTGPTYEVIRRFSDINGVSALEWCVFKPDVTFCPTPQSLREAPWFQKSLERGDRLSWIPVLDIASRIPAKLTLIDIVKGWAVEEMTVALEVGLRQPGDPLQAVVDWAMSGGTTLRLGFYGAFGDQWLLTDPRCPVRHGTSPLAIYEDHPPTSFDNILAEASIEGHDHRNDLELFKGLGYSWIIADRTPQTESILEK